MPPCVVINHATVLPTVLSTSEILYFNVYKDSTGQNEEQRQGKEKKKRQSTENFLFIQFYSFYHFKISFLKKLNTINGEGHVTHIGL